MRADQEALSLIAAPLALPTSWRKGIDAIFVLEEYCSLTERSQSDVLSELIEAVLLPRIRSLQSHERDDTPPA